MKKIIILLCIALLAIGAAACKETDEERITFNATIIELDGTNAIVEPSEGEPILASADKISIDLGGYGDFEVGYVIEVQYDGAVMESYPAQVNVLGIERIN